MTAVRSGAGVAIILWCATPPASMSAQNFDTVQVRATPVANGVHMLVGAGGNIGVSVGDDGVFLVDDQYAPLTERIRATIARISERPLRFVLNTHWHGDHTGGNENLGRAGTLIVAHQNVRKRMSVDQFIAAMNRTVMAAPPAALPVVTFNEAVTFHLNGDEIEAFHVPPAHTDGDAIVHFRRANVVHMGDVFNNSGYPFVDLSSGGSVHGIIGAADRVLGLIDDQTKVIPGHGPLADKATLRAYRDMVATLRDRVRRAAQGGQTVEQVLAAKLTADFDDRWGRSGATERFVRGLYQELKQ